jgi:hypothetical protein
MGMYVGDTRNRQVRAAENQSLFRDINERIRDGNSEFRENVLNGAWLCECADETCVDTSSYPRRSTTASARMVPASP